MFNHMALEPRCGALRPGALQLGGAQTGYLYESKAYCFTWAREQQASFFKFHSFSVQSVSRTANIRHFRETSAA